MGRRPRVAHCARAALPVLGCAALARPALAQYWIAAVQPVNPNAGTICSTVDLADQGVLLGQQSGPGATQIPYRWTIQLGRVDLPTSGTSAQAGCLSRDGVVSFATRSSDSRVLAFIGTAAAPDLSPLAGFAQASTSTGDEAFGYEQSGQRVPKIFDRLFPALSQTLGTISVSGHTTLDVQVTSATTDGLLLLGRADYRRNADNQLVSRTQIWNRNIEPVISRLIVNPGGYQSYVINAASNFADFCAASAWNADQIHQPWFHRFLDFTSWPLPMLAGDVSGDALDISGAGFTLVGNARSTPFGADHGRVWCTTLKLSARSVESLLASRGIDLSHWSNLTLDHISPDGQFVSGSGDLDGVPWTFVASVGQTCCVADVDDNGMVDLSDFFAFFNCWDLAEPCADLDDDPDVNLGDFFAFFNAFDAGC